MVDKPTNFTYIPRICIDLVFTSNPSIVDNIYIASHFCGTHSPVCFDIKYKTFKQYAYKRTVRDYRNAGFEIINNGMDSIDWDSAAFNSTNINDTYNDFLHTVHQVLDRHIPEKVITVMPKDKLFMNKHMRLKVRQRNRIHKTAKSKNCLNRWGRFRQIRNEIISMLINANEQYKLITNTRQMVENYKLLHYLTHTNLYLH